MTAGGRYDANIVVVIVACYAKLRENHGGRSHATLVQSLTGGQVYIVDVVSAR